MIVQNSTLRTKCIERKWKPLLGVIKSMISSVSSFRECKIIPIAFEIIPKIVSPMIVEFLFVILPMRRSFPESIF